MASKKSFEIARPFISADQREARLRAIRLYRMWYRNIPYIITQYSNRGNLPLTAEMMKAKLREEFYKNKNITDLRARDLIIHEGYNDLQETIAIWSQQCHIMGKWWKDTLPPNPTTFMDKFYKNAD